MAKEIRNPVPAYFAKLLETPVRDLKVVTTVEIDAELISDDVLERIDGNELSKEKLSFLGKSSKTFAVNILNNILINKDDDTNETTKYRIELLYHKIKNFHYFKVIK